jgi:hypothetical protein
MQMMPALLIQEILQLRKKRSNKENKNSKVNDIKHVDI